MIRTRVIFAVGDDGPKNNNLFVHERHEKNEMKLLQRTGNEPRVMRMPEALSIVVGARIWKKKSVPSVVKFFFSRNALVPNLQIGNEGSGSAAIIQKSRQCGKSLN